jgi:hypothetical protein
VLISLVSGSDLLERLNPTEEPFDGTALLVEFWIKPYGSPAFRLLPGSPIDRDIAPDSSFPVVLANFPGIIGRIYGDNAGTIRHLGNLKCFEGWLVEPGIVDICRGNCAGKGKTVPIDQSTQFVPVYLFIAIIAGRSPFFAGISLVSVAQWERSIFLISYPDRRRSRKITRYTPFSQSSRWYR